jgi:thiamine kinase-like enzyme
VKVFESDVDIEELGKKIMLIERVIPGTTLQSEPLLENRLFVFSNLYTGLHIKPNNPELYQTYIGKMDYLAEIIGKRSECKDLYSHALKAKDVYASISAEYNKKMLLHGDFHFNNILLGDNGTYTIIDPQGLVGDPVFEIARYIMIEYYHYTNKEKSLERHIEKVNKMIDYFTHSLLIPDSILRKCFYVEMVTMGCWDASINGYNINDVIFADIIMKNNYS